MSLDHEEVEIERVPVNRIVEAPTPWRRDGDITIVPVFEEILVVEKKLLLKEEVRIRRRNVSHQETRQVPVRREKVEIVPLKKEK